MTSFLARHIDTLYFGYRPVAGHMENCSRRGTDIWEVTRYVEDVPEWSNREAEVTLRLACHECGVVHFETSHGFGSSETALARNTGYGSKPEKVLGAFLYPGPPVIYDDKRGPVSYLVTSSKNLPLRPEDVLGRVGWVRGPRGGVKWGAGAGWNDGGTVAKPGGQDFASKRAAVAWVLANCDPRQTGPEPS